MLRPLGITCVIVLASCAPTTDLDAYLAGTSRDFEACMAAVASQDMDAAAIGCANLAAKRDKAGG